MPGNLKIAKTESNVLPDNVLLQFLHDYIYKNVDVATVEKNILKNADGTPETKLLYFLSQKEFLSKIDNIHSEVLKLPPINKTSVELLDLYASQQIKDLQIDCDKCKQILKEINETLLSKNISDRSMRALTSEVFMVAYKNSKNEKKFKNTLDRDYGLS